MPEQDQHYDDAFSGFLEEIWGDGYLSPGGPEEVSRVLTGLDLTGMTVLDIGCGKGAITLSLVQDHGAAKAVGIDVEEVVCTSARARAEKAGFADQVEILQVEPGPLPFDPESFDLVFSKDAIIHIADKEALAAGIFRVLRPGGIFAASDWLRSDDGPLSPELELYVELEGLGFEMASPARYVRALKDAGFEHVTTLDRTAWYRDIAIEELATLAGPRRAEYEAKCGVDLVVDNIAVWEAMVHVLKLGELCPHHLRGHKPG